MVLSRSLVIFVIVYTDLSFIITSLFHEDYLEPQYNWILHWMISYSYCVIKKIHFYVKTIQQWSHFNSLYNLAVIYQYIKLHLFLRELFVSHFCIETVSLFYVFSDVLQVFMCIQVYIYPWICVYLYTGWRVHMYLW